MSLPRKLRYGILGCGHASADLLLPAFRSSEGAQVAAVASRDPEKARRLAQAYGCAAASSYEELLKRDDVDIVYVGLPVGLHVEWTLRALDAGKHVLCEKTLAPSLEETRQVLNRAQERRRRVMEGFMFRFHGLFQTVQQLMSPSALGPLLRFVGEFGFTLPAEDLLHRDPAMKMGVLNESGCYPLCAARILFGRPPETVTASLREQGGVDFAGEATLQFGMHRKAECSFGYERPYRNAYTLYGEKALVSASRVYSTPPDLEPELKIVSSDGTEERRLPAQNHFARMMDAFCAAVASGGEYDRFEGEIERQARLMEAVRISARKGRSVSWAELAPEART